MSKQTIAIHLPDGAVREVPAGTTPLEIANSISPRLAAAAVVARLTPLDGAVAEIRVDADGQSEAAMYAAGRIRGRGWWTCPRRSPRTRGWSW